ncbi:MAG: oligopeptide transport system substrate-binding protein, partial [Verrucomicrobiales bacterium]|nr:oligopeptide transport system substrate-binding protein [Verrucomicrobiales bacterium]
MRFEAQTWTAALLSLVVAAGCTVSDPRADLVVINGHEPESLDPAIGSTVEDSRVGAALFEGFVRNDPVTAAAIPSLAERWDISPDGRVYTFHLRTNVQWSTGEPIHADDFVYSWRRVLDPKTGAKYAGQLFYVKNAQDFNEGKLTDPEKLGIHALDSNTVRVELNAPTAFFLDLITLPTFAIVPRFAIEKYGDAWVRHQPVPTSGAYTLETWRLNDRIRVRKNLRYWDAANTKLNSVDFLPVAMPSTALNLYDTGEADVIWDKDLIPAELQDALRDRPDYHTFNYLASYFLRYNVTQPPFKDVRVRKALAMAIDKKRIVEKITRAGEQPATHLVPNGVAHYDPADGVGYDPDAGRKLLAEAGYPSGKGFPTFNYLLDSGGGANVHSQIAVEIQNMWERELGIHVELRQMEKKIYVDAQDRLDYNVSRSTWIGDYNDPNTFLDLFRSFDGNNRTGWKNARYDQLMNDAGNEPDMKKRTALLTQAETILDLDDVP